MLPSAARASTPSAGGSASISSAFAMRASSAAISSTARRRRPNWRQRDTTVTGRRCGSVVARRNLTCGGGSSRVFRSALKLWRENMCTSSMRYTLERARIGAYCTLSRRSRVSSTRAREAASTSMRSAWRPSSISRHAAHAPQGRAAGPRSQFRHLANMRAMVVLPTPRVPEKR